MSGARAKAISEINLEEFERRLRASAGPQQGVEDPLAELTRLVDTIAAERPPSDNVLNMPASRLPKAEPYNPPQARAPQGRRPELQPPRRAEIAPPAAAPEPVAAPSPVEEAPLLRAAISEPEIEAPTVHAEELEPPHFELSGEAPAEIAVEAAAPPRPRGWGLKVGGLVAAAAIMATTAVVFKVGMPGATKAPPMIMAASTPTKVAPPSEAAVQSPSDSGSLLQKDTAQPTPVPAKLMTTAEQPIDLSARPTPQTTAAPNLVASNDPSPVAPVAASPVVPPADAGAPAVSSLAGQGQRVKTISVRPDGTLIASSYETASAPPQPAAPQPAAAPPKAADLSAATEPATPTVALPTKLAPPKSSARVVAKTDTTAPAEATEAAAPPPPAHARKPKPPKDAAVADAQPAAEAPQGGGHWAVQLGAPGSESEAQSMISKLKGKYSDALDGAALGVHKADRNGETIYRVRAGGLSKAAAAELCSKVKSAGGDCFLAKN